MGALVLLSIPFIMVLLIVGPAIYDHFFTKPIEEEFDAIEATATLSTERDSYTVTRKGDVLITGIANFHYYGDIILKSYLKSCRSFIEDDNGKLIPVHKVSSINIVTKPLVIKYSYKK